MARLALELRLTAPKLSGLVITGTELESLPLEAQARRGAHRLVKFGFDVSAADSDHRPDSWPAYCANMQKPQAETSRMLQDILSSMGRSIFALRGWTCDPLPTYWQDKQVIIGFPHTTIMDTVMAFAGFAIVKKKGHVLVRNQDFRWPYAGLLKKLGAIPVDRSHSTGLVQQMAAEFARRDEFQLALVPEGTRRDVDKIKTGFWYIAKEAGVPIVCWYLDNDQKRTRWAGRVLPGPSLEADLETIRVLYENLGYPIPGLKRQPNS